MKEISEEDNKENNKNNKDKSSKKQSNQSSIKWLITVSITTFILSILFSLISTNAITNLPMIPAIIILLFVIFIGILTDIIGVAVTIADEDEFHAKATKKVPGSKVSIKLIRNSAKVANVCGDVIGDICGVLSGSISALLALKITSAYGVDIQFFLSALVASLTVGGKAIGKELAQQNSTKIVHKFAIVLNKLHMN